MLLPVICFVVTHKFYVSVTNIGYSEKEDALQITSRVFIDDLEKVLQERYGINMALGTEAEAKITEAYLEKYLRAKFVMRLNGKEAPFTYIGQKTDNDVLVLYLEIPKVGFATLQSIEIQNEMLTDLFEEQQNVVHFKLKQVKKSFILLKDNNKGVLNL